MDKQEAKAILRLYRPGSEDAQTPQMAEALQLAREDAELGQWLEGQLAFNQAMRSQLKKIPVPPDLQGKILRAEAERRGQIIFLKRMGLPLAAAAAVALLAVVGWLSFTRPAHNDFAAYRDRIVRSAQRGYAMSMTSTNLEAIHQFIRQKQYPDYTLTAPLARLSGLGCATMEWHDQKVSMICLNARPGRELFLFVMDDGPELRHGPVSPEPEFTQIHRLMTASWADGNKIYILAGPGAEADLKQYLN